MALSAEGISVHRFDDSVEGRDVSGLVVEDDVQLEGRREEERDEERSTFVGRRHRKLGKKGRTNLLVGHITIDEPSFHEIVRMKLGETLDIELLFEICREERRENRRRGK